MKLLSSFPLATQNLTFQYFEDMWICRNYPKICGFVGSVAERIKAPFLWRPCDHDCV